MHGGPGNTGGDGNTMIAPPKRFTLHSMYCGQFHVLPQTWRRLPYEPWFLGLVDAKAVGKCEE